ncbi:hypothetical protein VP01_465g1 [Puccinia sorghi]|uniref:Uncharacterized protein n=1 Tax=Puccinia sorghi TaxID=27349 RepID=A0A0L6UN68_9BASI|nr:hypothetical protein VP01_465g1 [Puccinia sorghi]
MVNTSCNVPGKTYKEDMAEEENDDDTGKNQDKDGDDSNIFLSQKYSKKKNSATNGHESNKFHEFTPNLCFVVRRVTGSSAWQQDLQCVNSIEGRKLEPRIAGYGIC